MAEYKLERLGGIHALREARWMRAVAALLMLTMLSGCVTTRNWTASDTRNAQHALDPGDRVVVILRGGERVETTLKRIDRNEIDTAAGTYKWDEIDRLEADKFNAGMIFLGGALLAVSFAIALGDAFEDGFSGDD